MQDYEYWNTVGEGEKKNNKLYVHSNSQKLRILLREVLKNDFEDKKVFEIGCGSAVLAASLNTLFLGGLKYKGIDISESFLKISGQIFKLNVAKARSTDIPIKDSSIDFVFMFDVFEHIQPEERQKTGQEIGRILKPGGMLIMNSPLMESKHDLNFDFGITPKDIDGLEKDANLVLHRRKIIHYSTASDPIRAYIYEEFKKC